MIPPSVASSLEFTASLIAQTSHGGVFAVDRALHVVFWSPAMEQLWGRSAAAVVGQPVLAALPAAVADRSVPQLDRALTGVACAERDLAYEVAPPGHAGSFDAAYAPLRADGEIVGAVAVICETTRRRVTEQQLSETEQRFRNMADASPVLLWMSRTDSLCTFFNQTWLDFTGRTMAQEWGVGWAEGVHPEDLERCLQTYVDAFNARHVFEMEYRLRRADGEYRWILDRGTPRYAADGTFAGFIGSCIDITDRRTIEAALRKALVVKDEFLGLVSHELRTPLTTLQLLIERLRLEDVERLSSMQVGLLDRMDTATRRLAHMIESVLHYSRMQSGKLRVDPREIDLVAEIEPLVDEVRPSAARKGLELVAEASPAVPPIVSDPDVLRLIVSNLVSNAIKFTAQGRIGVAVLHDGGLYRIAVSDTGRGIPAAQQARIFEPFEQLEPSRQKHTPGVGLGLALVRAMADALGGRIELVSEPGVGSTFTVVLPQMTPRP
jgi:PAS domain S-box-containing protein